MPNYVTNRLVINGDTKNCTPEEYDLVYDSKTNSYLEKPAESEVER